MRRERQSQAPGGDAQRLSLRVIGILSLPIILLMVMYLPINFIGQRRLASGAGTDKYYNDDERREICVNFY